MKYCQKTTIMLLIKNIVLVDHAMLVISKYSKMQDWVCSYIVQGLLFNPENDFVAIACGG